MPLQPDPHRPASRPRYGRALLLLVAAAVTLVFLVTLLSPSIPGSAARKGWCLADTEPSAPGDNPAAGGSAGEVQAPPPPVTVYVTSWCPACTMTINYLKKEKIPFTVKDIEKNRSYMDELLRKTGAYRGVPVLEIGGKTYLGFHPSLLDELRRN